MTSGPLDGIRILDLSSVVMGPLATQMLGDLGAEVIVVEDRVGDINRSIGPGPVPGLSGVALNLMRNKRSVRMDLKKPAGRQAFLDIAATCDVVITNLRPGPLGRLGLAYDDVAAVRPDVVFCQAHGFASTTDKANDPAYDDIIQSASGIPDLFVRQGHEPMLLPTLVVDKVCGMTVVSAVLAAIIHRLNTGQGQFIEVPMFDVITSFLLVEHGAGSIPEPKMGVPGHNRILTPWRKPQRSSDGLVHVMPYNVAQYRVVFEAGGRPDLADWSDGLTRETRFAESDRLYQGLNESTLALTTDEWLDLCSEHGIPCTKVGDIDELIDALEIVEHPVAGAYRQIPSAVRYSATPPSIRRPAPVLGEHGREVLAEVGYDDDAIDELEAAGALIAPG